MRPARRLTLAQASEEVFSDTYGGSLPYSLAHRMAASGAKRKLASSQGGFRSAPKADLRSAALRLRTLLAEFRRGLVSRDRFAR